jgi:hypothetical protein
MKINTAAINPPPSFGNGAAPPPPNPKMRDAFQQLGGALKSGDTDGAKKALTDITDLIKSQPVQGSADQKTKFDALVKQLGAALEKGDTKGAMAILEANKPEARRPAQHRPEAAHNDPKGKSKPAQIDFISIEPPVDIKA